LVSAAAEKSYAALRQSTVGLKPPNILTETVGFRASKQECVPTE